MTAIVRRAEAWTGRHQRRRRQRYVLRSMQMARDIGYRVILVFIGIDSVEAGKVRVQNRVLHGGHDIVPEAQDRRFANARRAAAIVNRPISWTTPADCATSPGWSKAACAFADGSRMPWLMREAALKAAADLLDTHP